jgi:hypothetical protein
MRTRPSKTGVPSDQRWFYRSETQRRIRKAETAIAAGRVTLTRTLAAAQAELDRHKSGGRRRRR